MRAVIVLCVLIPLGLVWFGDESSHHVGRLAEPAPRGHEPRFVVDVGIVVPSAPEVTVHVPNDTDAHWDVSGVAVACWAQDIETRVVSGDVLSFRYDTRQAGVYGSFELPGLVHLLDGRQLPFLVTGQRVPPAHLDDPVTVLDLAVDETTIEACGAWNQRLAVWEPDVHLLEGDPRFEFELGAAERDAQGGSTTRFSLRGVLPFDEDRVETRVLLEDRVSGERLMQRVVVRRRGPDVQPAVLLLSSERVGRSIPFRLSPGPAVALVLDERGRAFSWSPDGRSPGRIEVRLDEDPIPRRLEIVREDGQVLDVPVLVVDAAGA